ncbi:hypothetical protein [Ruminiclostridium papyrosolvens]|uniref:Uncharacterized protein n=1 Tax=Ruminiclostridium papyrosolvens C7 TaxID=1330534 RepID=U4R5P4_9FIRM|nr:hypothetical protein [Ruminiclostridium papyrosolvens]EPR13908.1 hypothetical protein L323_02240 [Ruminiclostridium papyrosolvens C7]
MKIIQKYFFFQNHFSEFCSEKTGGMGENPPIYVQKTAPFWGGYVRRQE